MDALTQLVSGLVGLFGLVPVLVTMLVGGLTLVVLVTLASRQPRAERLPSFSNDYARGIRASRTQALHDDPNEWRAYADRSVAADTRRKFNSKH